MGEALQRELGGTEPAELAGREENIRFSLPRGLRDVTPG